MKRTIELARAYVREGWSVIPMRPRSKFPAISWKEFQKRIANDELLVVWFVDTENNIAIVTGRLSGIIVVDLDSEEAIEQAKKLGLPEGPRVLSGGGPGKLHCYFQYFEGSHNFQQDANLPGIDLRAEGGCICAPNSIHPSGGKYKWVNAELPIPPAPQWVIEACKKTGRSKVNGGGQRAVKDLYKEVPDKQRNMSLTRVAGQWCRNLDSWDEVLGMAVAWNKEVPKPPLPESEVVTTVRSVYEAEQRRRNELRRGGKTDISLPHFYAKTDTGNAERFIGQHGHNVRFSKQMGEFLYWNGNRWTENIDSKVEHWALATTRAISREGAGSSQEDQVKLQAWSDRSESDSAQKALLSRVRVMPPIPTQIESFDRDPYLLNVKNGTLELNKGMRFRESRREDLITKQANVIYRPEVKCPQWEDFLAKVFAYNVDLIRYIQKTVGYCLTGDISEQSIWLLYGSGRNGKNTFTNILLWMFGEYAKTSPFHLFVARKNEQHPTELAHLKGARLISAEESDENTKMSEGLVKLVTGGSPMAARYMRQDFFEFLPTHKIFFQTNHLPEIHGADFGIWRRIKPIPFNVRIAEADVVQNLDKTIFSQEASGILNWALEGLLAWQREGLKPPTEVSDALASYRAEMDVMSDFIADCCELEPRSSVDSIRLFEEYTEWCKKNRLFTYSHKKFVIKLVDKIKETKGVEIGLDRATQGNRRELTGISIRSMMTGIGGGGRYYDD